MVIKNQYSGYLMKKSMVKNDITDYFDLQHM